MPGPIDRGDAGQEDHADRPRSAGEHRGWVLAVHRRAQLLDQRPIARAESDNDVSTATIGKIARALGLPLELTERG